MTTQAVFTWVFFLFISNKSIFFFHVGKSVTDGKTENAWNVVDIAEYLSLFYATLERLILQNYLESAAFVLWD